MLALELLAGFEHSRGKSLDVDLAGFDDSLSGCDLGPGRFEQELLECRIGEEATVGEGRRLENDRCGEDAGDELVPEDLVTGQKPP